MYTSDMNKWKKMQMIYAGVTAFCIIGTIIYEHFSYGEYSMLMRLAFLFPLLGGVVVYGGLRKWKRPILTLAYCLWNSGIAIFISGCLVGGIITISGRSFAYGPCYWATGLIFLVTAVAAGAVPAKGRKILS